MTEITTTTEGKSEHIRKTRKVPMEVLCLGRERTGTTSIQAALRELGYQDVYHMNSVLEENLSDSLIWTRAFDSKYFNADDSNNNKKKSSSFTHADWDDLLGNYMATCDEPACYFAPELTTTYPSAKIIITVRDSPEQWLRSVERTTYQWAVEFLGLTTTWDPLLVLSRFLSKRPVYAEMMEKIFKINGYDDGDFLAEKGGCRVYEEHNESIRRLARERAESSSLGLGADGKAYLDFNAKDGWGPLCAFLGKPIPQTPYPNLHSSQEFERNRAIRRQKEARRLILLASQLMCAVGAVGVGFWLTSPTSIFLK